MIKKIGYGLALIISIFVLVLCILFIRRPELMRVLRYQSPDAETYKLYPQSIVRAADTPFHFVKAERMREDLDSIRVFDRDKKEMSLKAYLEEGKTNLFMVIRNDTVIYQKFAPGYSDTTLTTLFSVAKSMVSIMLGQAIEEGKIKSLDDPLLRYVPELKSNPVFDQLTLRNLMEMKSGLEFSGIDGGLVAAFLSDEAKYYYTQDMKKELLKLRAEHPPGKIWKYKSIDVLLLSWALENATGKKTAAYFQDKVWTRIGTEYPASWGLDHKDGLANTASRFQATAIDLAKIGRLYLLKGAYKDHQVIPEEWVRHTVQGSADTSITTKGWQKTRQNYLWWVPLEGDNGDFAAEGMRGQRLYVDPLTNTIIVQLALRGAGDYPYRKVSRYLSGLPFTYPR
ncbi:serine hydrolase domain-containing protein [Pedobacter caeni]|uniref:CubicO group peptidase, beta-lactamase class C family n=1 Tax=Pedobacter caeni TaxID=288992 RepID=A0A1M5E198_9SPHI|nr:serine hydrolase [Pedobacter caeni]SHF72831.1 CubicO group peptidase, beta-lactamase class C family [Pedobacter caeni]